MSIPYRRRRNTDISWYPSEQYRHKSNDIWELYQQGLIDYTRYLETLEEIKAEEIARQSQKYPFLTMKPETRESIENGIWNYERLANNTRAKEAQRKAEEERIKSLTPLEKYKEEILETIENFRRESNNYRDKANFFQILVIAGVYELVVGKRGKKEYPHLDKQTINQRGDSRMETNEQIRRVLSKALEEELETFLEQVSQMTEGELKQLEEQVVKSSQAIGRKLMEGVLNSRLHERRPVTRREGSCGHVQRLVGERPKELITLVGPVSFVRAYYQCLHVGEAEEEQDCTHGEAPADVLWGVDKQRTTPGVQGHISYLSARLTFEEAAETLCRSVPIGMSGRQALTLMRPVGATLATAEDRQVNTLQAQAKQARSQPQEQQQTKEIERLYIELDGVLARMRRGSVPMEKEELRCRGDVYREIKAGAVFRAERGSKRSELAPGVYVDTPAQDSVRYVAHRTAKGGFDWLLYQLAVQCGLEQAEQVVVVGDGAPWIWNLAAEHFPGAVQIVDLYHAKEHVWDVAHAVFGRGTAGATVWATHACALLEQGQSEALVFMISALPPIPPEPGQARSIPERAVDYFTTHAQRMRYPLFRAQGMHIGSGIAEAACKTIVSTRAKRCGMRWTPEGLDALLPLRTAVLNGAYDSFWEEEDAA